MKIYVTMTDAFMSGWGMARNKTNKYIIVCDTMEQAQTAYRNALKRSEMKRVNIRYTKPYYGSNVLPSFVSFSELGPIWTS
jgi:hypothetical protein